MSPTKREREYARRRYEKWQERRAIATRKRRQARRTALLAIGAVALTLAVVGAVMVYGPDRTPTASTTTPSAPAEACPAPPEVSPATMSWPDPPEPSLAEGRSWDLTLQTSCGTIGITLDGAKAPQAVASTVFLARQGFWDNTRCHRLSTDTIFVLQCGDPTAVGDGGPGYSYGPVENAPADAVYPAGTVAMARQGERGDSMGSQFFLVYEDSTIPNDSAGGYSVIGTITSGLDVVRTIADGGVVGGGTDGAPERAVAITSTTVG